MNSGSNMEEKGDANNNSAASADVDKLSSVHGNLRRVSGPTRRSSKAKWTLEEDDILRDAVQKYEGKTWKKIAGCLSGRTDVQCLHRWQKVLNPELVKGPWSKEEDDILISLVGTFGEKKWSEIAEQLPGRMGKQCRERWFNHLKPEINKSAWTDEEERILINAHAEYGNKWSIITKLLPGRTQNSVKNHWNCSLKKRLYSYSASGSAVNRPQRTIYPLQPFGMTRDSAEANQTQELVETDETPSTVCSWKESVDRGSNRETSLSGKANIIEITNDMPKTSYHGSKNTQAQGFGSLDKPSPDVCGGLEGSSEWSYTGLCYEPVQREDVVPLLCDGRFRSSESSPPPSRWQVKEAWDSYRRTRSILRSAAMSYRNMPSIIRKRAFRLLHPAPDNGVPPLNTEDEVTKVDDDQGHTSVFLSQMSESLKSLQPLNI